MALTRKMLGFLEENSLIKFILITAVILSSVITIGQFVVEFKKSIFVSGDISKKMESISAGESIEYFREKFGKEVLSETIDDNTKEVLFIYKTAYIQAIINSDKQVIFYSITDCVNHVEIYNSAFDSSYISDNRYYPKKVILNDTTFADFFKHSENVHLFISGATANSYYYEYEYGANPGGYQTFFIGINDVCRFPAIKCRDGTNSCDIFSIENINIKKLRTDNTITTYGEMAGGIYSDIDIAKLLDKNKIYLGPDRVKIRMLKLAHYFREDNFFEKMFKKIKNKISK